MGQKLLQNSLLGLSLAGILIGGQPQKKLTNENELIKFISETRTKAYKIVCNIFQKQKMVDDLSGDIKNVLKNYNLNGVHLSDSDIDIITDGLIRDLDNNGLIVEIFKKTQESEQMFLALLFALIYGVLSKKIISKIREEHDVASNLKLSSIIGINGFSFINNGAVDSIGLTYLASSILGVLMIYFNNKEQTKIDEGIVKPNRHNARLIGLKMYEHILHGDDAYIVYDINYKNMERKIQIWNTSMEKLTGYSEEEVMGWTHAQVCGLLFGYDEDVLKKRMDLNKLSLSLNKFCKTFVFNIKTKEGIIIPVAWKAKQLHGGWLLLNGTLEETEIKNLLRKDNHFNCLNLSALKEDFQLIINKDRETDSEKGSVLSLMFGDIDLFGEFNKTYGHKIGDIVLEYIIENLKEEFKRGGDGIYRKGGDEFIILCNKTNKGIAGTKIDNLRNKVGRVNLIINYKSGIIDITTKEHENPELALAYFNNYMIQKSNKDLLCKMGLKGGKGAADSVCEIPETEGLTGTLVLPPIFSTWGVVELNKSELENKRYDDIESESILGNLIDRADVCTLNGKNGGKNRVIIEGENN